jgi:hypothetical protein
MQKRRLIVANPQSPAIIFRAAARRLGAFPERVKAKRPKTLTIFAFFFSPSRSGEGAGPHQTDAHPHDKRRSSHRNEPFATCAPVLSRNG